MKYWVETTTADVDVHCEIAAEFLACPPKAFIKVSVCGFSTRTGTTPEIIEAAKFCQEQGARTLMYVSNDNTPATENAEYKFFSFAEDDGLCEAIYTYQITLVARFLKNAGAFPKYDTFMEEFGNIAPYLIKAKDAQDERCAALSAGVGLRRVVVVAFLFRARLARRLLEVLLREYALRGGIRRQFRCRPREVFDLRGDQPRVGHGAVEGHVQRIAAAGGGNGPLHFVRKQQFVFFGGHHAGKCTLFFGSADHAATVASAKKR